MPLILLVENPTQCASDIAASPRIQRQTCKDLAADADARLVYEVSMATVGIVWLLEVVVQ